MWRLAGACRAPAEAQNCWAVGRKLPCATPAARRRRRPFGAAPVSAHPSFNLDRAALRRETRMETIALTDGMIASGVVSGADVSSDLHRAAPRPGALEDRGARALCVMILAGQWFGFYTPMHAIEVGGLERDLPAGRDDDDRLDHDPDRRLQLARLQARRDERGSLFLYAGADRHGRDVACRCCSTT